MATSPGTVTHVLDQIQSAGIVEARKMFGEYAVYCNDRMVGLICDDQLFLKPTDAGAAVRPELTQLSPYPGAKPAFVIPAELLDDAERLSELVRMTAAAMPQQQKRKKAKPE